MANAPFSIRLDPFTAQTLQEAAGRAGSPVATYAAHLIRSGLSGEHSGFDESTCLLGVVDIFKELDDLEATEWALHWSDFVHGIAQQKHDSYVEDAKPKPTRKAPR